MIVFRLPHLQVDEIIPPYAEVVRFEFEPLRGKALRDAARERLRRRLARLPRRDPVEAFGRTLAMQSAALAEEGEYGFHDWAFHTLRQLGANFELLAEHVAWLDGAAFAAARENCTRVSEMAKTLQFQMARSVARGRAPDSSAAIVEISRARKAALVGVAAGLDALTSH